MLVAPAEPGRRDRLRHCDQFGTRTQWRGFSRDNRNGCHFGASTLWLEVEGADPTMNYKLALSLPLLAFLAWPVSAQTAGHTARAVLIHGNYCGPGNNAPAAPVDALDAACARHDACTPDGGLATKACNLRLQKEADAISRDPRQSDELRAMAGLVSAGASMMMSAREPATETEVARSQGEKAWAAYTR